MKYLKYIGKGAILGIPARDLTKEETEKYGGEKLLTETGMWQACKATTPKKQSKQEEGE